MKKVIVFVGLVLILSNSAIAAITGNISNAQVEITGTDTFKISEVSITGLDGTYWGEFKWDSDMLVFQLINYGKDSNITTIEKITGNISNAQVEITGTDTFKISEVSITGLDGTYWGEFKWDPDALVFQLINYGPDSNFAGTYSLVNQYDLNISDGVTLGVGTETFEVTQIDSNNLSVQISGNNPDEGAYSGQVPLVVSGNIATLPTHPYDTGTANFLELVLLSDGNNMVYTGIGQEYNNPADISLSVGNWLKTPKPVTVDSFVGTWSGYFYSNSNLRYTSGGFSIEPNIIITISKVDADTISIRDGIHETVVLDVVNDRATLMNTPWTGSESIRHAFSMVTDGTGLSLYSVTTELNDPTDVSVTVGLFKKSTNSTYSISGTVTVSGSGLQGVTMTLSGSGSATVTTDASGNFSFINLANGSYTITPSKTGYMFNPTSSAQTVNNSNITDVNFAASVDPIGQYSVTFTSQQESCGLFPPGSQQTGHWLVTKNGNDITIETNECHSATAPITDDGKFFWTMTNTEIDVGCTNNLTHTLTLDFSQGTITGTYTEHHQWVSGNNCSQYYPGGLPCDELSTVSGTPCQGCYAPCN